MSIGTIGSYVHFGFAKDLRLFIRIVREPCDHGVGIARSFERAGHIAEAIGVKLDSYEIGHCEECGCCGLPSHSNGSAAASNAIAENGHDPSSSDP